MSTAVVTGASSGIGRAIAEKLLDLGYPVIGISRTIEENPIEHENFRALKCDLSDTNEIIINLSDLGQDNAIDLLVNAAGFGLFAPHEEISPLRIGELINVNLTAPIILSNLLLRMLKINEGMIINITSIEATKSSKFSALYTASKSGLRAFSLALFEEVRKSGVNVVSINPDMTDTNFFNELNFTTDDSLDKHLLAEDIAEVVENILNHRVGVAINEVTVRAQRFGIHKKGK